MTVERAGMDQLGWDAAMEPAGDQLDDYEADANGNVAMWPQWSQPETSWMTRQGP